MYMKRKMSISLALLCAVNLLTAQPWQQNDAIFNPSGIPSLSFSQPRFADLDGDNDLDMVIGNIVELPVCFMNVGSSTSPKFQLNDTLLQNVSTLDAEMAVFYDLDADGDLDLIAGGYRGLTLYRNSGTAQVPIFPERSDSFPNVNAGSNPIPDFTDIDSDGDYDMVLGFSESGAVRLYTNTGNAQEPIFSELNSTNIGDVGLYAYPVFGDLDNDNDIDLLVGRDTYGFIYFQNNGDSANAVWQQNASVFSNLGGDTYWNSPDLTDLNGDGKLDLIYGTASGPLLYYRNTGTSSIPSWTANKTLFGGVIDVGGASSPFFFDFDGDSDLDMICGTQLGYIKYYENTGTVTASAWKENSSRFSSLKHSIYSAVTLGDINGDSLADAIVGDLNGNLYLHVNTGTGFSLDNTHLTDIALGGLSVPRLVDFDSDGDLDLAAGNENGNLFYFENQGSASVPDWVEINEFFDNIDVGSYCVPTLSDLDGDGDYDFVTGNLFHEIQYYENADSIWIEKPETVSGVTGGQNSAPAFVDLDGDGDDDLVIGNYDGTFNYYENMLASNEIVSIKVPSEFRLFNVFPNPFNPVAQILFELPKSAPVTIRIFDLSGRQIFEKHWNILPEGKHKCFWDGARAASGVYIVQVYNGENRQSVKAVLMK
ncbi:MAG: hypothetical protein COT43_10280 [Candidatus Marinimicrobia bacterium CG08_land_8_20_14_0_20_45_22]|nr:MAG: hypothetical protein COT43_10280 [Candidatus Marinimicrobia bacterium CG08_land_8_20_14_0_20_45_22]